MTHAKTTFFKEEQVNKALPNLFQDDLLCAGNIIGNQGSCKGDSGGPLMIYNLFSRIWTQIGIVHGAVGQCGEIDYPGIYIRLNHHLVIDFISGVVENRTIKMSPPTTISESKMI